MFYIKEPLKLKVGNEYNLNNVKEIKVTDEFLTLEKTIINCQNKESQQDCKTRKYIDAMLKQCKCLSFATINDDDKVIYLIFYKISKLDFRSFVFMLIK